MKLKSYFCGTVEAAVEQARRELGPDAMLVDSRRATPESGHLGEYEVVFASLAPPEPTAGSSGTGPKSACPDAPSWAAAPCGLKGDLRAEFADLRKQLHEIRRAIWRSAMAPASGFRHTAIRASVLSILAGAEVDPPLAQEISACVEARLAGDPLLEGEPAAGPGGGNLGERLASALAAELEGRFSVDPALGRPGVEPRVAALVGPPGSGKTTALVKLAVARGLTGRRPVHLISMDTCRIAAAEQLRSYAAILGAGFEMVETGRALEQSLELHRSKGLILIDTPGFGPREMDSAADLAALLTARPEVDIHLVLPASMKPADLSIVVDRFEIFRPSKLLFTRMDETGSFGPILSEAARTGKPVSFLAGGQEVPEDLEEADKRGIIARIFEPHAAALRSVA